MAEPSNAAPELRLFDCYALAGVSMRPPLAPLLTAEALLAEMDHCGIDEALVHSDAAECNSPVVTNPEIAVFCEPHGRLHPVWNILPAQTGEMLLDQLLDGMREHGVRALCARPDENRFLLNGLTFGEFFDAMIERGIPLFLQANWARITEVLKEFPKLTVIATGVGVWGQDRYYRPLVERFENFYLESSAAELDGGIPAHVRKYGPDRILFGSGSHRKPMGGASLLLRNLDLDAEAKSMIAHGNLERLLGEVRL